MTDDATTVAGATVFQGTGPIDGEFFEERVISGGQGAYRAILDSKGKAPVDVTGSSKGDTNVLGALCFVQNKEGEARGVDLLMAGKVHIQKISNHRFWPDAPEGFTQIHLLDMASMPNVTNKTTTLFTEADYSVSHKEPGAATFTDIPEGEWADKGVGGLSIRRHTTAESPRGGRFYITAIPANIKQAKALGKDVLCEEYPGITISDGSWAWDSPEDSEEGQGGPGPQALHQSGRGRHRGPRRRQHRRHQRDPREVQEHRALRGPTQRREARRRVEGQGGRGPGDLEEGLRQQEEAVPGPEGRRPEPGREGRRGDHGQQR